MPIPSPSIKPLLIPGGTHTARYVGAIGVSANSVAGTRAQGTAQFYISGYYEGGVPGLEFGDILLIGPDDLQFAIVESNDMGSGNFSVLLQATQDGPAYHFPIGTEVRVSSPSEGSPNPGELITTTTGGTLGVPANSALNIDLTAFSARLRSDTHFVEQLLVTIQSFDDGIADVSPYTLLPGDFHGTPVIEYLTLNAVSDSDANEFVVTVKLPHSHTR